MLNKEYFVFQQGNNYFITQFEESLPPNKIAARVHLNDATLKGLMNKSWREYQSLLEHYYDHGQKLVTA